MIHPMILNSRGEPIKLNALEQHLADRLQRQVSELRLPNSLGEELNITTLTSISKKISEQKFFTAAPADYIPMPVSMAPYSTNITTYRSFRIGGQFADGVINMGTGNARLASASAGVDALNIKVVPWGKSIGWTIMELEYAQRNNNWDLITAMERARKENWDLGIQATAFLGLAGNNGIGGDCLGLLNQPGITTNDADIISKPLSTMTPAELKAFQYQVINFYRANNNRTAWPKRFVIPESDFLGLMSQASPDFPIKSTLQLLEEGFQTVCGKDFKILPLAYSDAAYHDDVEQIVGKQVYTLYNPDEESMKMEIPLDYTNTLANSIDNFSFQNAGYGQFTGLLTLRPLEQVYFTFDAP